MNSKIVKHWNGYLKLFPEDRKDIYYTEEYVNLYEAEECSTWCVVCEDGNRLLLMPFVRKEINGYFDFETAYGYGGPISNVEDRKWINTALKEMYRCFEREKYICGFIRFHPLLKNSEYCYEVIDAVSDRKTIAVNTHFPENIIWEKQITSKNRNMIRKAEKNNLVFKAEYNFESIKEFEVLYNTTMKRLCADEFYLFPDSYYQKFCKNLNGYAFLGTVRHEGHLVSAALFMYSDYYGHYHLAGSDRKYSSLGLNNLLLWKSVIELKKQGIKEFHLGGGTGSSPDDSLFKFKKSFSRNEKNFCIGKCVFNNNLYKEICERWEQKNPEKVPIFGNRILKYRF